MRYTMTHPCTHTRFKSTHILLIIYYTIYLNNYNINTHSINPISFIIPFIIIISSSTHSLLSFFFFFLIIRRPPNSPLFPYPTLFRSTDGRKPYHRYSFAGGIDATQENVGRDDNIESVAPNSVMRELIEIHTSMYLEKPPNDGHRQIGRAHV